MAAAAPGAAFPMDVVTAEKEIYQLVISSDLSDLTSAKVRKHLNEQFGIDFSEYKQKVNDMTRRAIEKMQSESESKKKDESDSDSSNDSESDVEENKPVTSEEITKKQSSSDSDSDPGVASTDRKKKKKKTGNSSNEPEFGDMMSNIKSSRRAAASKAMRDIRKSAGPISRKGKTKNKDEDADFSGKFGRMTRLCYISSELQEIVGNKYMKRCDVVKSLWDYIKEHDLKDPKNKQHVICDEKLEVIFKRKRFLAFGMTKFLTKHIIEPKLMGPEYEAEANDEMNRLRAEWMERKKKREEELKAQENGESQEPAEKKAKIEEDE